MPAVCKFFLKGYCRYGRNCRFEHPGENYNDDYSLNEYQNTPINFSFKTGSTTFNPQPVQPSITNNIGFSFRQSLESNSNSIPPNVHDVDMSEGFSFRQNPLENNFNQNRNILINNQASFGSSFLTSNTYFNNSFQQQQQQQQPFAFQTTTVQRSPFDQIQPQVFPAQPVNLNNSQPQSNTANPNFSNLSELTEAELKEFRKEKFEYRRIPIKPPPQELCR